MAAKSLNEIMTNYVSCGATADGYAHWVVSVHRTGLRMVTSKSVCGRHIQCYCLDHPYSVSDHPYSVSVSGGSSKMSAICLASARYLRSCSGRKLISLRKWPEGYGWTGGSCSHLVWSYDAMKKVRIILASLAVCMSSSKEV